MPPTLVYADLEGDLLKATEGTPHLVKRLSTQVAWHVFDPRELIDNVRGSVVASVHTDLKEQAHYLHYQPKLEALDLERLRDLVRVEGLLAGWRMTRLALELCGQLRDLHDAGIPQGVIHPERIGLVAGRFVLIPTLPGFLEPLPRSFAKQPSGWIYFVAPEVLRSRAGRKEWLLAGDVYSLGRVLEAVAVPRWEPPPSYIDWSELAERIVERAGVEPMGPTAPALDKLMPLIRQMTSFWPEERPALEQVLTRLNELERELTPLAVFEDLLRNRQAMAAQCLREMEASRQSGVFACPGEWQHLMKADLALAQSPPDINGALGELSRIESSVPYMTPVRQRMGRAYALYTSHPQQMKMVCENYEWAAALSDWQAEIVDEWAEALHRWNDSTQVLEATHIVPQEKRTKQVVALRTRCHLQKNQPVDAWYEIALSFPRFEFDPDLFALARRAAEANDPLELVRWLYRFKDRRGTAAPQAIVWMCNENKMLAEKFLNEAKLYVP